MPTGYTAPVQDGTITDLRTFILRCARAMGALIMMRDDPMDAPIRKEEVSDYHPKELAKARERLAELQDQGPASVVRLANAAYEREMQQWMEERERMRQAAQRYGAMLAKVEAWQPPPSHEGLKEFMVKQLRESMEFDILDLDPPKVQVPQDWWAEEVRRARKDIAYHEEQYQKEKERVAQRNQWVDTLLEALPEKECTALLCCDGSGACRKEE